MSREETQWAKDAQSSYWSSTGGSEPICWSSGTGINKHSVVVTMLQEYSNSNPVTVVSNVGVSCHSRSHQPYQPFSHFPALVERSGSGVELQTLNYENPSSNPVLQC